MKFDVVVGNPPYQTGNGESGGARSLWRKFVKTAFTVTHSAGYVAIICPGFPYQSSDIGNCFCENTPLVLKNDVSVYFPGIGSEIKYWVVRLGKHGAPFIVDGAVWSTGLLHDPTMGPQLSSILNKVAKFKKFECKQDRGYSSTQLKNDMTDYFENPTANSKFPIRHASKVPVCYVKAPTECHYKRKVMMTFSGYPNFGYYDEHTPMSSCYQMSGYIEVVDASEGDAVMQLFNTTLYKFLSNIGTAGMRGITNYSLPKISLSHEWTDQAMYKHFKLTPEEIAYVEANVK